MNQIVLVNIKIICTSKRNKVIARKFEVVLPEYVHFNKFDVDNILKICFFGSCLR